MLYHPVTFSSQRLFIFFCEYCLAATWFKKYWPVRGSAWNKRHVSRNNATDMTDIIDEAMEFTRVRVQFAFLEAFTLTLYHLLGSIEPHKTFGIAVTLAILHGYPLCIHHYNRILARAQLSTLKKDDTVSDTAPQSLFTFNDDIIRVSYMSVRKTSHDGYLPRSVQFFLNRELR